MDLNLACRCGKVTGLVHDVSPGVGNRLVCYCKDCQAFARTLERAADTLNDFGGTEIFQINPSQIEITGGLESVSCLRLTEKGLYRWFAGCCNTPLGNTGKAGVPFVGLVHTFISEDQNMDALTGPVQGTVYSRSATEQLPAELKGPRSEFFVIIRMLGKLLSWKLTGKGTPNPFFNAQGRPLANPRVPEG